MSRTSELGTENTMKYEATSRYSIYIKRQNIGTILHISSHQLHRHFMLKRPLRLRLQSALFEKTRFPFFSSESWIMPHHLLNSSWMLASTTVIRERLKFQKFAFFISVPVHGENEGGIKTDLSNLYTCKKWNFTSQGLPGEIRPIKAGIKSTFEADHFVG